MALPEPLPEVATEFDRRALELSGVNRMVMGREINYRKGNRYALTLSTDDASVNVWALLGESPDETGRSGSKGRTRNGGSARWPVWTNWTRSGRCC